MKLEITVFDWLSLLVPDRANGDAQKEATCIQRNYMQIVPPAADATYTAQYYIHGINLCHMWIEYIMTHRCC